MSKVPHKCGRDTWPYATAMSAACESDLKSLSSETMQAGSCMRETTGDKLLCMKPKRNNPSAGD